MVLQQLLWLMAATTAGVLPHAVARPAPPLLPAAHHLTGVPLAENHPNWCGPVALAAVLQYSGDSVSAEEIAQAVYLPRYRGSLNLDLLLYARRRGFTATAGGGSAGALRTALARGRPVICLVRARGLLASTNHYVVVRGYDETDGVWFVDRGEGREVRVPMRDFAPDWERCGRWMLTVEERTMTEGQGAAK